MFENMRRQRFGVMPTMALTGIVIALAAYFFAPQPQLGACKYGKSNFNSCGCCSASFVVDRGVKVLRQRTPAEMIRGMIDSENPDIDLCDFENAALVLAPKRDARAEFILGWLCANDAFHLPNMEGIDRLFLQRIDFNKLGLTVNQQLAAQWYVLSSVHGCSAASIALGRMLDNSYGGDHEKSLAIAASFYKKGIEQGDDEAKTHLACSYAYGRGVKVDRERAWNELEEVIKNSDTDNSTFAIDLAIQAWKDGKITPPPNFSQGAANAYEFVGRSRYAATIPGANLDQIYTNPGCVPNPYPQYRWDLATEIRKDWLQVDTKR